MTPAQKVKWLALAVAARWSGASPPPYPCEDVDDLYAAADVDDGMCDAIDEVRGSGEETGLRTGYSRHYESSAVAKRLPDGTWVGWTYWYGGGKHGEPSAVPWMEDAYGVTAREETRVVLVFERSGDDGEEVARG